MSAFEFDAPTWGALCAAEGRGESVKLAWPCVSFDDNSYAIVGVGRYVEDPDGDYDDEGERVAVAHPDGVHRMPPAAARMIAAALLDAADEIDPPEAA